MEQSWRVVESSLLDLVAKSAEAGRVLALLVDVIQIGKKLSLHLVTRSVGFSFRVQQVGDMLQPIGRLTQLGVVALNREERVVQSVAEFKQA